MSKRLDSLNIVLIGMSGAGKTSIGKNIARKLNMEFIDTDDIIIESTGKSIDFIFKEYGEEYFRQLEKNVIEKVSLYENKVISTGGGVILNEENVNELKKKGVIYYLSASVDTLYKNLSPSIKADNRRPLLKYSKDLIEEIRKLYEERESLYISSADYIIEVDGKLADAIGDELISIFNSLYSCS